MAFFQATWKFLRTALNTRVLPFFSFRFVLLLALLFFFYNFYAGQFTRTWDSVILRIVMYYLVISLGFLYASRLIVFIYRRENKKAKDFVDNFILGIQNFFFAAGLVTFLFVMLYIIGIDLVSLFTSLSIIAFALAFTFKDYISNFLAGFTIMFSDKYRLKDYIEVGGFKGRITDITFQNVVLKTDSKNYVYLPNTLLVASGVVNYSKEAIKTIRVEFAVDHVFHKLFSSLEKEVKPFIVKEFSEFVSDQHKIHLKVEKLDKDNALWALEVYASKYTFKLDEDIKYKSMEFIQNYFASQKVPSKR